MKKIYLLLALIVVTVCLVELVDGLNHKNLKADQATPLVFLISIFLFWAGKISKKDIKSRFGSSEMEKLRIPGGENPPLRYWNTYPNWEPALDEEEKEGQDELTLKPSGEQKYIEKYVAFTAGDVMTADGRKFPAFISVAQCPKEPPDRFDVYINNKFAWSLAFNEIKEEWWVEGKPPSISINDPKIFPLIVSSRLPRKPGGKPYQLTIEPGGVFNFQ